MRAGRLRNKLRKIREQGEEASEEGGELNVIPYLDIVVNVIMFMLATATFAAQLSDISVSSPTTSQGGSAGSDAPPKQELNLTVSISDKGFTIAASGAVLFQGYSFGKDGNLTQTGTVLPTIPKKADGEFDYAELKKKMTEIRGLPIADGETKVIVNANENILYEVLVGTLDASRGKLIEKPDPENAGKKLETYEGFPDVLLSAGVN